uniref:RING-type E3 ubiquitin transferase n=1 Tax=Tetradesmus obliquus TaxID=3088 RepID=A0A383VGC2_TETOB|eukprot:jgi/Sobl393_1/18824/SZX64251.1
MADDNDDNGPSEQETAMRKAIMAIMMDTALTDAEKSQKRQQLMCGGWKTSKEEDKPAKDDPAKQAKGSSKGGKTDLLEDTLKCVICVGLCERPVTGPCQHNFCLACFKRWLAQGKKTCPTCRTPFPNKFIENPRINTLLTYAIRCAKQGVKSDAAKTYNRIADESRPAEAFTTERAVRNGRANAASGRIMVNVPNDHFGPILPEHDPSNGKGVQVGDWWKDRLDCRQWGAHFPHVAGIAGQSNRGAQSVVLSGGYEDDHDEGEWFLYTGSGGRDLSGNKRTNKTQSFDQEFENMNKALKLSCLRGLPVRVVRSFKEKRSSYAPPVETPVRYDGLYRILRCWRKKGAQGFLMCRYLFVRCDNAPAPWTSDETGDAVRLEVPGLAAKEIKEAKGTVFEMADNPYWDWDEAKGEWGWAREAPPSQKAPGGGDTVKKLRKKASAHERLLKDFACGLCKGVLDSPLSMPCGHNFCKGCLDKRYAEVEAAKAGGGSKALAEAQPARSLRVRKVPKPCPTCKTDIADYMAHAAVNTEMAELIRRLQEAAEAARREADQEADGLKDEADEDDEAAAEGEDGDAADGEDADAEEEDGEGEEEEEEEPAAAAKKASKQPAKKGQRTAAGSSKAAAAAAAEEPFEAAAEDAAAAAEDDEKEQQPAAAAAAAAPAASRYAAELSQLCESFPDFDRELIAGMLEDQGGDVEEVHAYLKRMKNQLNHAKRSSAKAASGQGTPSGKAKAGKGRGKGSSKGKKQQAAAAGEEEQQQEVEPAAAADVAADDAAAGEQQAEAAAAAVAALEDAARDTPPPLDAAPKVPAAAAADKPAAGKAAAAAAAGEAAGEAAVGKKRRQGAAAGSGKSTKRAK